MTGPPTNPCLPLCSCTQPFFLDQFIAAMFPIGIPLYLAKRHAVPPHSSSKSVSGAPLIFEVMLGRFHIGSQTAMIASFTIIPLAFFFTVSPRNARREPEQK